MPRCKVDEDLADILMLSSEGDSEECQEVSSKGARGLLISYMQTRVSFISPSTRGVVGDTTIP
jgi:hypothetical protein